MDTPIDCAALADLALRFSIRSWAAWAPGLAADTPAVEFLAGTLPDDDGSLPDVDFLPAMLRRRLGRTARMALHVAHLAAPEPGSLPNVFASRHGELRRTTDLLQGLARGELPSPASFSLSVHNASAGIHAIARNDPAPSSAIAAGDESLLWALLDARQRIEQGTTDAVLVVHSDDAIPSQYLPFAPVCNRPFALAIVVEAGDDIALEWRANGGDRVSPASLPISLAGLCAGANRLEWHGERLSITGLRGA
ncbi:beta-ketoacyl synthase chain length factor [Azoarcus taiwanensis]|uniref:3-oxoacyl-ACP synthase n=1 Tax=Azoarcus taiwanensis TaxID=666964 RepID=A0A972F899_9RHOO|nr:beta-ketoacyl synthase chain length factor [Azoarcus taiwanensis]NMG03851.1 3-oxoacyl-ACP synthase [Azoarcus taiwanensis]